MTIIHTIILAVVEGITEFLPISSTGHMILASKLMGLSETEFLKTFEIVIQIGAIFSVIFLYRYTFLDNIKLWKKVFVAFIPTGVVGFVLYKFVKHYLLGNSNVVVFSLIIGGVILILFEKFYKKEKHKSDLNKLTYKNAFLIGLFQSISIIPGVSRAGATIIGAMALGIDRKEAVEFSFLLAVPTMFAATALDLIKGNIKFESDQIIILLVGTVIAFITAHLTIKYLLKYVQKHNFTNFGIYRIVAGLLFWIFVR